MAWAAKSTDCRDCSTLSRASFKSTNCKTKIHKCTGVCRAERCVGTWKNLDHVLGRLPDVDAIVHHQHWTWGEESSTDRERARARRTHRRVAERDQTGQRLVRVTLGVVSRNYAVAKERSSRVDQRQDLFSVIAPAHGVDAKLKEVARGHEKLRQARPELDKLRVFPRRETGSCKLNLVHVQTRSASTGQRTDKKRRDQASSSLGARGTYRSSPVAKSMV